MKKNIKEFKNTKMPETGKLPDEYFINVFEENNPETTKEVVDILSIFNAQLLAAEAMNTGFVEENRYPLICFMLWFYEQYGENKEVLDAISDNWEYGPRILNIAAAMYEDEMMAILQEEFENLEDEEKYQADKLADTIWDIRAKRTLSFSHGEDEASVLILDKYIPKKILDNFRIMLLGYISRALSNNGSLILRIEEKENIPTLYGFVFRDGNIENVSSKFLRDIMEDMSDQEEDYREMNVNWKRTNTNFS